MLEDPLLIHVHKDQLYQQVCKPCLIDLLDLQKYLREYELRTLGLAQA